MASTSSAGLCKTCQSEERYEMDGYMYCKVCDTQDSGGPIVKTDQFIDFSKSLAVEVTVKRHKPLKPDQLKRNESTSLWTTSEAFTHILCQQMQQLAQLNPNIIQWSEFKTCVQTLWRSYLRKTGIAYTDNETPDSVTKPRLHPSAHFRDRIAFGQLATESLPKYRNKSKSCETTDVDMDDLCLPTTSSAKPKPLSYLADTKNVSTDHFLDLMTLPKTLALLHIAIRLLGFNIFATDLIRWARQQLLVYHNCFVCFPDKWLITSNDWPTFTTTAMPSYDSLNRLSAKLAKYIGVKTFPRPKLHGLVTRFVTDFNLPKDMIPVISNEYDLYHNFVDKFDGKGIDCRQINCFPSYEKWVLMTIVLVLKRVFTLDDGIERRMSHHLNDDNVFNWSEWQTYATKRLDLIHDYHISLFNGDYSRIKDVDVLVGHLRQRSDHHLGGDYPSVKPQKAFNSKAFRNDLSTDFKLLVADQTVPQDTHQLAINHSLHPLIYATDMSLKRVSNQSVVDEMSKSFADKCLQSWMCGHGRHCFDRPYYQVIVDPKEWSKSFTLVMRLAAVILGCQPEDLIPTLKRLENKYFSFKTNDKPNKRQK